MTTLSMKGLTPERAMQRIRDEQGYIIITGDKEYKRGDVIDGIGYRESGMEVDKIPHKLVVIGTATVDEYIAQTRRFFGGDPVLFLPQFFYKVTAE